MPTPRSTEPAGDDVSDDILSQATARLGVRLPGDPGSTAASTRKTGADDDADPDADQIEVPAREQNETDEDYAQRLEDAGLDPAEHMEPAAPAAEETDEERAARLQQVEGETDEDYEARLDEEGLTRADVPEPAAVVELTEEEKKAAAQKARDEADLKKLPEPVRKTVQAILDKRFARITAKTAAEKTELTDRVATLETQLAEAKEAAEGKPQRVAIVSTIHPLLLDPSDSAIADYVAKVEAFEDWAADHEDGYEPTPEELAKGYAAATKTEIRARLRAMQRERDKLVGQAKEILAKRAPADADARKIMPALFDATKPEYQAARTLLREQPELKKFPDYNLRVAEILLGRKALADLRKTAGKTTQPKPAQIAPRAPGGGSATKGGFGGRKTPAGTDATSAASAFAKAPTRENLTAIASSFIE